MLDRKVPHMDYKKLSKDRLGELLASIWERVQAARERQRIRFEGTDIVYNSDMRVAEVRKFCKLDEAGESLVRAAMSQQDSGRFHLSWRNSVMQGSMAFGFACGHFSHGFHDLIHGEVLHNHQGCGAVDDETGGNASIRPATFT